jgi:hypothetical protein
MRGEELRDDLAFLRYRCQNLPLSVLHTATMHRQQAAATNYERQHPWNFYVWSYH